MNAQAAVYLRNDQVIVIPQGGGGGYYYDIEPVSVVSANNRAVEEAIQRSLEESGRAKNLPEPDTSKPYRSPALKRLGVRSIKEFCRNSAHCFLYEESEHLVMLKFAPARDGKGFELTHDPPTQIDNKEHVGSIVLDYLQSAPRAD